MANIPLSAMLLLLPAGLKIFGELDTFSPIGMQLFSEQLLPTGNQLVSIVARFVGGDGFPVAGFGMAMPRAIRALHCVLGASVGGFKIFARHGLLHQSQRHFTNELLRRKIAY